jgi:uncharacterized protein YacL
LRFLFFIGDYQVNVELIFRIIGMLILTAFGVYWGIQLAAIFELSTLISSIVLGLVGAVIGFIFTPYVTTRPATSIRNVLSRISAQTLVAGVFGLVAGLLIAALAAFPLSLLPSPFGDVLPFIGALIFAYFGIVVFVMRQDDIINVLKYLPGRSSPSTNQAEGILDEAAAGTILLDTSVIIDGRIADIARTGFLVGSLLIPRFVLNEARCSYPALCSMNCSISLTLLIA